VTTQKKAFSNPHLCKGDAPPRMVGSCHEEPRQKYFALGIFLRCSPTNGGGAGERSETEGAALQSNAVEGAALLKAISGRRYI